MPQAAKVINLDESYVPVAPNAYPDNRYFTQREDHPYSAPPIVPYEGYNFMPTPHGYKSYFGTQASLGIDALDSRVDNVFIVQTTSYQNILVALCEDGIWTKTGEEAGAWVHEVVLAPPEEGMHLDWSYCLIGKELYMYRAGSPVVYVMKNKPVFYEVDSFPGVTVNSVDTGALTGGIPAGDYSVQVAYENADGAISAPGNTVTVTLTVPSAATILFQAVPGAVRYRVYITTGGQTYYYVKEPSPLAVQSQTDQGPAFSAYYTVVTLPDTTWMPAVQIPAYGIIEEAPTFLNMEGQAGIFRAGMSLGFWDTEDSIAWSSIDDLLEFTPSITSMAGNAIFSDVQGRITKILSHEQGFIIYSTRSIVWVRRKVDAAMQWEPTVLLSGAGVAFPSEVAQALPDNTHFVYTSIGLYRIVSGEAELLVPEVVEYLKEMQDPVALQVLQGRYLCLQMLDPEYIEGLISTKVNTIPAQAYTFPIDFSIEDIEASLATIVTPQQFCYNSQALAKGATEEQQAAAAAAVVAAGKPPKQDGTVFTPIFTAYLSVPNAVDPENIVWTNTPCATVGPSGTEYLLSPGIGGTLDNISQELVGKIAMTGSHWNIDTFVATQLAIWQMGDNKRQAFLQAIINKAATDTGTALVTGPTPSNIHDVAGVNVCPVGSTTTDDCSLGSFISAFSNPHYGLNSCSFWLTRYAIEALDISRRKTVVDACDRNVGDVYYFTPASGATEYASQEETIAFILTAYYPELNPSGLYRLTYLTPGQEIFNGHYVEVSIWRSDWGSYGSTTNISRLQKVTRTITPTMNAHNVVTNTQQGVLGVDTGWLEQVGWTYTDTDGNEQTVSATSTCTRPAAPDTPPSPPSPTTAANTGGIPIEGGTGTLCGLPYTPIVIPGISEAPIDWTTPDLILPAASFLLQDGSIGPVYPTYVGMLVYDLQLKKWGKMKQDYKVLVDYSPINNGAGEIIPYETFGMQAGSLKEDGQIHLFDQWPADSYIKYGKIGYHRLGMTDLLEVKANFRGQVTGALRTETSLDGQNTELGLDTVTSYEDATQVRHTAAVSGRWHNIIFEGQYDITHLEYVGSISGRR